MAGYTGTHNPLLANYFEFTLDRVPNMVYFCQTANLPGLYTESDVQPTSLGYPVTVPTGNYKFENLQLTFKVDEDLRNWLEIFNWMKGLGNFGEACSAYPYSSSSAGSTTKTDSNAMLILTNSTYKPKIRVKFNHVFPVSLSGIAFSTILPESVEVVATVEFAFSGYSIERL
jgi:hypothetical protein